MTIEHKLQRRVRWTVWDKMVVWPIIAAALGWVVAQIPSDPGWCTKQGGTYMRTHGKSSACVIATLPGQQEKR